MSIAISTDWRGAPGPTPNGRGGAPAPTSTRVLTADWTVEAYLKAIGVGVRGGLLTRPAARWTVLDLDVGDANRGALAVEAAGRECMCCGESCPSPSMPSLEAWPETATNRTTSSRTTPTSMTRMPTTRRGKPTTRRDQYIDEQLEEGEGDDEAVGPAPTPMGKFRHGSLGMMLGVADDRSRQCARAAEAGRGAGDHRARRAGSVAGAHRDAPRIATILACRW